MEQGSPKKSASASSNQKKQLHNGQNLTHGLNPLVHSSSQECPIEKESSYSIAETSEFRPSNLELLAAFQSKQTQQIGTSFSRAPLWGESLSQLHGANEDLSAFYFHGNSYSHDQQLFQTSQVSKSGNELIPNDEMPNNTSYNEVGNTYNLPLSNLPPEFCLLTSSSRHQGEHIGSSQTLAPFGSSVIDSSIDVSAQKIYSTAQTQNISAIMLETSVPLRSMRTHEGIPYPLNTASGFDLGSGSSSSAKGPTTSALKRKMNWQDEKSPSYRSWNSFGRGYQRYSSRIFDAHGGRYTLYDKRYEDIGLPVDPHLRIFNATNGNGNGESSKKKN